MAERVFVADDFSRRFSLWDRQHYLPALAQVALGLTDVMQVESKARAAAIQVAEDMLPEIRRRVIQQEHK